MLRQPLIVNFLGAPGSGKSTTATELFSRLKRDGQQVEYVPEFAKDLTWEKRHITLGCQPYILGKQLRNLERLVGQVDIIVTDSPIVLSAFYAVHNKPGAYPDSFQAFVLDQFRSMPAINVFLTRSKPYNPNGRSQNEAESDIIGRELLDFLEQAGTQVTTMPGDTLAAARVASMVKYNLDMMREAEAA